ncbi:hypothetical protein GQ54DRAFT_147088 [Martensiomyces pterosporus]|nr:hypothetical protein GQ54DRAFT_147088 [Martensiomyces pterosporus]
METGCKAAARCGGCVEADRTDAASTHPQPAWESSPRLNAAALAEARMGQGTFYFLQSSALLGWRDGESDDYLCVCVLGMEKQRNRLVAPRKQCVQRIQLKGADEQKSGKRGNTDGLQKKAEAIVPGANDPGHICVLLFLTAFTGRRPRCVRRPKNAAATASLLAAGKAVLSRMQRRMNAAAPAFRKQQPLPIAISCWVLICASPKCAWAGHPPIEPSRNSPTNRAHYQRCMQFGP